MKLDQLLQSLLLTSAVIFFISTPTKAEEIQKDGISKYSVDSVGKSSNAKKVAGTKSPVLVSNSRKPRTLQPSTASSVDKANLHEAGKNILQLSEIKFPSTSARMLVQTPTNSPNPESTSGEQQIVLITGVKANPTDKGLEVILQTSQARELQVVNRSSGNNFIADIPNAQLQQANGDAFKFSSEKPLEGITEITVTNLDANTVRITATGQTALPKVELFDSGQGLIFGLADAVSTAQKPEATLTQPEVDKPASETPSTKPSQEDETIELLVTGERNGYRVPNATTATRTDTPLKNIPQSIQVVPQEVLKDQRATSPAEALQNVAGVSPGGISPRTTFNNFFIRGFDASDNVLVNGLRDNTNQAANVFSNIERVEVLKGPASVLFGQGTIGGTVNYVTKQPLSQPSYSVEGSVGSFNLYGGAIDLSSPLNEDKSVLYRLNASAETNESFVDFYERQRYQIAPVLSWKIDDRTNLTLEADYSQLNARYDFGIPAEGSVLPNPNGEIERDRFVGEPDIDNNESKVFRISYNLEHRFNDSWKLRSALRTSFLNLDREIVFPRALADDKRTLNRGYDKQDYQDNVYNLDNYVVGEFATGNIQHKLVAGFNLYRQDTNLTDTGFVIAPLDVFNPVYGSSPTDVSIFEFDIENRTQVLGIYIQDQISFGDKFKVLLGGRFDTASQDFKDASDGTEDFKQYDAFSPRIGIVYQPIEPISLYASYNRSFQQTTSVFSGALAEPERGSQYEVGVKADLNDRLSATLAYYNLTRSNVETSDPNNPALTIQVGEQRSRGIEFDISGEISPGWKVIAGYAYTNAEVTEDNDFEVGNQLNNIPKNAFNIWTTYEIQSGDLRGLGFGLGLFYFSERPGDLANTFDLPGYTRTDAAIFYKRDNFRAALNFRNLFDIDYFVSAQNRNRVFPGEPLTVVGSISWEF